MSDASPPPEPPVPAVLRAQERLEALRELREIGMDLVRALQRRVAAEEAAPKAEAPAAVPGRDPADAFAALSRAVRLTVMMETRTDEALMALCAGVGRGREDRAAIEKTGEDAVLERVARADRIRELVKEAARDHMKMSPEQLDRLDREMEDRSGGPAGAGAMWNNPDWSLSGCVEVLSRYYRISPDWSRWDDELDGKGWIPDPGPVPDVWPWERPTEAADGLDPPAGGARTQATTAHPLE